MLTEERKKEIRERLHEKPVWNQDAAYYKSKLNDMREDVVELLDEVERLHALNENKKSISNQWFQCANEFMQIASRLKEENQHLRKALEKLIWLSSNNLNELIYKMNQIASQALEGGDED